MNRVQQFFTGIALLGIALLVLAGLPALAQSDGVAELIGGTEASLREFILRTEGLLAATEDDAAMTIRIEALPDDLPFELPLPEGARPVGSIALTYPEGAIYRLMVDTALEPAAVLDFFSQALATTPWQQLDVLGTGPIMNVMYCYGPDTSVNINARRLPAATTDLQIYVNQGTSSVLCGNPSGTAPQPEGPRLLPELPDLPGVTLENSGVYTFGPDMAVLAVSVRTDLPLVDLFEVYNTLLADAGWTPIQRESVTGLGGSSWTLTGSDGQPWEGVLTLVAGAAGSGHYQAQISIQRLPAE